ncbi:hypothetical protein ACGFX8_37760 [Streptomyces sp. NPDC048362]|uniref:hypothetical protein n=1 Tax=Streptomyces sp. NPDC048362 TaxID=3365539 RepID=UPI00371D2D53
MRTLISTSAPHFGQRGSVSGSVIMPVSGSYAFSSCSTSALVLHVWRVHGVAH